MTGAAALRRGYSCLLFDGPGQGTALMRDGLVSRPDWEHVVTPVVDWLVERVPRARVALVGISFGGYLAARAAASAAAAAPMMAMGAPGLAAPVPSFTQSSAPGETQGIHAPQIELRALNSVGTSSQPLFS